VRVTSALMLTIDIPSDAVSNIVCDDNAVIYRRCYMMTTHARTRSNILNIIVCHTRLITCFYIMVTRHY